MSLLLDLLAAGAGTVVIGGSGVARAVASGEAVRLDTFTIAVGYIDTQPVVALPNPGGRSPGLEVIHAVRSSHRRSR